jgi:hypothetical protein
MEEVNDDLLNEYETTTESSSQKKRKLSESFLLKFEDYLSSLSNDISLSSSNNNFRLSSPAVIPTSSRNNSSFFAFDPQIVTHNSNEKIVPKPKGVGRKLKARSTGGALKDRKVSFSAVKFVAESGSSSMMDDSQDHRHDTTSKAYEMDTAEKGYWGGKKHVQIKEPIEIGKTGSDDQSDHSISFFHGIGRVVTHSMDVDSLRSESTSPSAVRRVSRVSRRRKDVLSYSSNISYQSMLSDTSTISPSKVRYSMALNKHRSMQKMIHPVEKHGMSMYGIPGILLSTTPPPSATKDASVNGGISSGLIADFPRPSRTFVNEFDYVIVFPFHENEEKGQSADAKYIMHAMLLSGLELFPYRSANGKELFVLIRAPVSSFALLTLFFLFLCFLSLGRRLVSSC